MPKIISNDRYPLNNQCLQRRKTTFDKCRFFFYITNDRRKIAEELIHQYRDRADHENDIEQLKNGVHALTSPSNSLNANWPYMVIASLAWDLKAWYGMLMPYRVMGNRIMRMEFLRFVYTFFNISFCFHTE